MRNWVVRIAGLGLIGAVLLGCEVVKVYRGAAITSDPRQITVGQTRVADVLELFGPPTRIQRQSGGEVFIYRYTRSETRKFTIEEPVVTNTDLYAFTEIREDSEVLVVMFDRDDVVRGVGYRNGAAAIGDD